MPDLDQLESELGPDLRAVAPRPRPGFALDVTVRATRERPRPRARRRPALLLLPALGVAAAALLALIVVLGAGRSPDSEQAGSGGAGSMAAPQSDTAESGRGDAGATSGRDVPPGSTSVAPAPGLPPTGSETLRPERAVERSAELSLVAPPADVPGVSARVARTARAAGGYVAESQVALEGDGASSASLTLRVPSDRLDAVIARVSELADVTALSRAETDVTGPLAAAEARLADARDERRAVVRSLGRATDPDRVRALRDRLREARALEERRATDARRVQRRADVATVTVYVGGTPDEDGAGTWSPSDAPGTALRVLAAVGGALLVAAAAIVPVALLLVLAFAVRSALRRRARERALAAAG